MSGLDDTAWTVKAVTANYTLTANDYYLLVSPQSATVVITLPDATTIQPGRVYQIRRDATATNVVQLARSGSNQINGGTSNVAVGSAGAIGSVYVVSDGTNWYTSA